MTSTSVECTEVQMDHLLTSGFRNRSPTEVQVRSWVAVRVLMLTHYGVSLFWCENGLPFVDWLFFRMII